MRFRAPRSISPSPVRRKPRRMSTFGLQSDSDESSSDDTSEPYSSGSDSDESIISSLSSDSFCYEASESEVPNLPPKPVYGSRNLAEQRNVEETIAAIRLRTRHHDPYEDWERQTRMDAFRTARKELKVDQQLFNEAQEQSRTADMERRTARHAQQMQEIEAHFEKLRARAKGEEEHLWKDMKARQTKIWEGIEGVIKLEEDKVRMRLAEEAKRREEEECKRQEEEKIRKAKEEEELAEKKAKEEEAKRADEEKQKQKEKEEEALRLQNARELDEVQQKDTKRKLGMSTAKEDWDLYHEYLQATKRDAVKMVKADRGAKSTWSGLRRDIIPKIGQLTSDDNEIRRISLEVYHILNPTNGTPHHPTIYKALLYSLSKVIILQAETEVPADKNSAKPLAVVASTLLETVKDFDEVFYAKLVQRSGGWAVPCMVPPNNHFGSDTQTTAREQKLAAGYKEDSDGVMESYESYAARISGILRVYFSILRIPPKNPLHTAFQLSRYWSWLTRLLTNKHLLQLPIVPELIYTALDVLDVDGRKIWGHQYNKLLELIYEGVTTGYEAGKVIGGSSPEAVAARSRVQTVIERVLLG